MTPLGPFPGQQRLVDGLDRLVDGGVVLEDELRLRILALGFAGSHDPIAVAAVHTYLDGVVPESAPDALGVYPRSP